MESLPKMRLHCKKRTWKQIYILIIEGSLCHIHSSGLLILLWVKQNCIYTFHHFDWKYTLCIICFGSTYLAEENKLILATLRAVRHITDISIEPCFLIHLRKQLLKVVLNKRDATDKFSYCIRDWWLVEVQWKPACLLTSL